MKRILLFSSPRSGSTLLSNYLRSHPRVTFYNEIFTQAPSLLPNFERAYQANEIDLRGPFEHDLSRLHRYKLEGCNNILHRSKLFKTSVFLALKLAGSVESRVLSRALPSHDLWTPLRKIYYLNALYEPPIRPFYETQFIKVRRPDVMLVKDVRMPKAYPSMKRMYPDNCFIYLIRNPYFVVSSEIRHRRLKSLDDLSLIDERFLRKRFDKQDLVDAFFYTSIEQRLALLWRLENELVMEDLQHSPDLRVAIVHFEDLVLSPEKEIRRLFGFLDLDFANQTQHFLRMMATYRGTQRHDRSTFVAVSREKIEHPQLSARQIRNVGDVLQGSPLEFAAHITGC